MARYIDTIDIKFFRGIKNLRLEGLAPINILTGDNNSGKTSVMEIIETLDALGNFNMWRSLTRRARFGPPSYGISVCDGLMNLFPVDEDELNIGYDVYFSDGKSAKIAVNGIVEEENMSTEEFMKITGYRNDEMESEDEYEEEEIEKFTFEVKLNGVRILQQEFYNGHRVLNGDRGEEGIHLANITYISPVRHAEGMVFLNRVLDQPELYEQMIQVLREFDPGIISINVDNANEKQRRGNVYKILSREHKKALPLNVYGDGMKKAVLLMSAVINTKGGVLLLDEFETAIHTTAMEKTFRWILETCMKMDVQLFLTTHSEEAIDKVLKCSPSLLDKIKLFTLYKNEKETVVRSMDANKAIELKDEMGIELR